MALKCRPPFKYYNAWAKEDNFFSIVRQAWSINIKGTLLFILVRKLSNVKMVLKSLQKTKIPINSRAQVGRQRLDALQTQIAAGSTIVLLIEERTARATKHCLDLEETILKQKSKDRHINMGEGNLRYFYSVLNSKRKRTFISKVVDNDGSCCIDREHIENVFTEHFRKILAPPTIADHAMGIDLSQAKVHGRMGSQDISVLGRNIQLNEIMDAIKLSSPNKLPERVIRPKQSF